ncbi:MAG: hypothetical protein Q7S60_03645 [bacterium]|nr:hypothetical protein [bacterium]
MKFRYKKYGKGVLRPVIPIEIIHKNTAIPYEVLVDSGADMCIFDAQIAGILGIDLKKAEKREVAGITGNTEFYYLYPIVINVGGWTHKTTVGFLPSIGRFGYGVVGQQGFFDIFIVRFDLVKEEIEIKRRPPS